MSRSVLGANSSSIVEAAIGQAVLMGVLQQRLDGRAVLLDAVRDTSPRPMIACSSSIIGCSQANDAFGEPSVGQQVVGVFLGAAERLVERQRHPRIAIVDVAADHHRVHDRIDLGAAVIVLLHLGVVRKQPPHLRRAAAERQRIVRRHQEVDLAALQQIAELGAGRRLREADVGRQLAAETVGAALHPFDVARLDAVFVLQQPAHIDRGRHAVFRHAAALALEVGGLLDALARC